MSIYSFKLPGNCPEYLQELYNEHSEETFFFACDHNPQLLIDLFQAASNDSQWLEENSDALGRINFQIIDIEYHGEFNQKQLETIASVCETILISPHQEKIEESIFELYEHVLDFDHAIDVFLNKNLDVKHPLFQKCLDLIGKYTKQKIKFQKNDNVIELIIEERNNYTDLLVKKIDELSDPERRKKIDIAISSPIGVSFEYINKLIDSYGNFANSLFLVSSVKYDDEFEIIAEKCRQINRLKIQDSRITKIPHQLTALTSLSLFNCNKLTTLPDEFTSLTNLTLGMCSSLQFLPTSYSNLTSLILSHCDKLRQIPRDYIALTSLSCKSCKSLSWSSKYELLSRIYQIDPERGLNWCEKFGIVESHLKLYSLIDFHAPELTEIMNACIESRVSVNSIVKLPPEEFGKILRRIHIPFNQDEISKKFLRRFFIYGFCSAICDESVPLKQKVSIVENLLNLDKVKLLDTFLEEGQLYGIFFESLMNKGMFSDDEEEVFALLLMLRALDVGQEEISDYEDFLQEEVEQLKKLLAKPSGRILAEQFAKKMLQYPTLQKIIMKAYPPGKPENLSLYPIGVKFDDEEEELMLTMIPRMPLFYPDAVFDVLKEFPHINDIYIRHYASPAIDQGGLSRQFVSQMMQGMRTESKKLRFETLQAKNSGAKYLIPTPSFNPTPGTSEDNVKAGKDEEKQNYQMLGIFLGMALRNNYPVGKVFDQRLFKTFFLFNDADLDCQEFSAESYLADKSPHELFDFIKEYLAESEESVGIKTLFENVQFVLESKDDEELLSLAEELNFIWEDENLEAALEKKECKDVQKCVVQALAKNYYGRLEVMHAILQGFQGAFPLQIDNEIVTCGDEDIESWGELSLLMTEQEFTDSLQGKLDVDWIKANLDFHSELKEKADSVRMWVHQWLDENKDNEKVLSNVIFTFTGSAAIPERILFNLSSEQQEISISTCDYLVHIPSSIDEESLRAVMDAWGEKPEIEMNDV